MVYHLGAMKSDPKPLKWGNAIKLIRWVFSRACSLCFLCPLAPVVAFWSKGVDPWYFSIPSLFPTTRAEAETFPWHFWVAGGLPALPGLV